MELNFQISRRTITRYCKDATTKTVLMLGYMNEEALQHTQASGKVTFLAVLNNVCGPKGRRVAIF